MPKNKNKEKPKVSANLSINGGIVAANVEIVSGLFKKSAYPVIYT